ncbi:MAG: 6-carboxytetrahydropterin synthase [Planctomycetaceae bacterium]|jgi:6-pyruvoyltetrahydropterin/6-carboxytetrahydropterin synthase|nr:6-carboxytetrahydropterin synthase [Planctomycetaceae bacterium]
MKHSIRFENESLYFSASHFITFGDPEKVEALHGHNFRVKAEIAGPMNRKSYVVDFVVAYDVLKRICEMLSHKVLLPAEHPYIKIKEENDAVRVSMPPLRWAFPKDDTLIVPLRNTTTEAIAEYILKLFRQTLEDEGAFDYPPAQYALTVELEESPGMWAIVRE